MTWGCVFARPCKGRGGAEAADKYQAELPEWISLEWETCIVGRRPSRDPGTPAAWQTRFRVGQTRLPSADTHTRSSMLTRDCCTRKSRASQPLGAARGGRA